MTNEIAARNNSTWIKPPDTWKTKKPPSHASNRTANRIMNMSSSWVKLDHRIAGTTERNLCGGRIRTFICDLSGFTAGPSATGPGELPRPSPAHRLGNIPSRGCAAKLADCPDSITPGLLEVLSA